MKRSLGLFCLLLALSVSVWAQGSPEEEAKPALPQNLAAYKGKLPDKFMKLPAVKKRLQALLKGGYGDFVKRMGVQTPFTRQGDFLVATGQIAHMGGSEEAILVIDLNAKALACAMFSDGTIGLKPRNVPGLNVSTEKSLPAPLNDWLAEKQKLLDK